MTIFILCVWKYKFAMHDIFVQKIYQGENSQKCRISKQKQNSNMSKIVFANASDWVNRQLSQLMRFWYFSSSVKLILQTRMRSHPVGLDVWFLVRPFVFFHTSCVRTAKALVRLCGCAGSPEPLLVTYVISIIISWAGSISFQDFPFV